MIKTILNLTLLCFIQISLSDAKQSVNGSLEIQHRQFFNSGNFGDSKGQSSARLSVELFKEWNEGNDSFEVETFLRIDEEDSERTHGDIRQLIWTHYGDNYEFSAGIGRVFFGVTESQHLVDIINQTDLVESIDGEDKLGQLMLRYQRFTDIGTFDAYILPSFRQRTFEGEGGRLNAGILVDVDNALYESNDDTRNLDYALRYSNTFADWDVGLSWFSGTSREPELLITEMPNVTQTIVRAQPLYPQLDQVGVDIQVTTNGWLLKLETVKRRFKDRLRENYIALTVGGSIR